MITHEIVRTRAGLLGLHDEWSALAEAAGSPLLSHEWALSAADAFCPDGALHIVTIRAGHRLVAVAPLMRISRRGAHRLELVGASRLHEPGGLLYADSTSLAYLCKALVTLPCPVTLQRMTNPDEIVALQSAACAQGGRCIQQTAAASPFIPIHDSWENYYGALSSRRRYDFRRARTRLEKHGPVTVEFHSPVTGKLENFLSRAFDVESSGWKGRKGSGLAVNPSLRRFFTAFTECMSTKGQMRICFLSVNNTPIAMQLAAVANDRWWVLKIGYNEHWADCSPGYQLTMETVRHAFESGLKAYEFLGTAESWLRVWTQQEHPCVTLTYYPTNTHGRMSWVTDTLIRLAGQMLRRIKGQN
jgi:CelD/BcsL family acetyltransferase involved in cellulose biosynthesis